MEEKSSVAVDTAHSITVNASSDETAEYDESHLREIFISYIRELESSKALETTSDIPEYHDYEHEYDHHHDLSEDDAATKMHHLMHSDTIIVVLSLVFMIVLGLVFRSLCMKLASVNQRKERMRGGLKQIAEHMNYVTRSMSNDLELPDSPRAVIRTYSNYSRRGLEDTSSSPPQRGAQHSDSLRVHAITNSLSKGEREELEMQMSVAQSVSLPIEMDTFKRQER